MRAVFVEVPPEVLLERRRHGLDLFDEMWEGELHMTPMPSWYHQGISKKLATYFELHWEELGEGLCCPNVGVKFPGTADEEVAGEKVPRNYRGPDLVFLKTGHEDRVQGGWVVGPPDAVLEIRSPGDETYEKLPFYFALGIPEVIIVHRDSRAVELHERRPDAYERVPVETDGSVSSRVLTTSFRAERDSTGGRTVLRVWRTDRPERVRFV